LKAANSALSEADTNTKERTNMPSNTLDQLVDALTLQEQVTLLSGEGSWNVGSVPRLGIGSLVVTDGPNGARGGGGLNGGMAATAFPVGIALGATWNPELMHRIGGALADEVRDKGAHVLLGPTINLQRGPLNGRNFECFSEDPVLTAELAVGYVSGLQEAGIAAMPKHFIANESEIDRAEVSSDVDERTLRELYLIPFERAVKSGGAWAVMSSYNRLNGTFTSENPWLLTDVLRRDWGFDGAVVSDWYGSHSTVETVLAGLDVEMPGPSRDRGEKLVAAVRDGRVPAAKVRNAALNVLRLMERCGALNDLSNRHEQSVERPQTRVLIREAAAEGIVLLKNVGHALPLPVNGKIAVVGPNAKVAQIMGGGSSQLKAHRRVSTWDGLAEAFGADALGFAMGCRNNRFEPVLQGPISVDWFDNLDLSGSPAHRSTITEASLFLNRDDFGDIPVPPKQFSVRLTGQFMPTQSGIHRIGTHCAGRARVYLDDRLVIDAWQAWSRGATFFEEGCNPATMDVDMVAGQAYTIGLEFRSDSHFVHDFSALYLGVGKPSTAADVAEAATLAATADVAIICVGRNAEWDTEGWDLPDMRLPGDQDALIMAIAARAKRTVVVLQTGGPVEMPWLDQVDAVIQAWYPGQEAGHAIADVLCGRVEPTGRLPQSFPRKLADAPNITDDPRAYPGLNGHVRYDEKLNIGYRHHDTTGIAPLFPFGFGLGYTEFVIKDPMVEKFGQDAGSFVVQATVANVGKQSGKTVVQLYVAPLNAPVVRPQKELKGFSKVTVDAGETQTVELTLSARDFAWFDTDQQVWVASAGTYALALGFSSSAAPFIGHVTIAADVRLPA
jgi:beta-glucosidase